MRRPGRSVAVGVLIIAAALGFLMYQGISNNVVYFIYPHELLAKGAAANGASFRLGGLVVPGSRRWNASTETLRFRISDPKSSVPVVSHGSPPEMFRAGIGVVVEGRFLNGTFQATNLMVKHSETYRAPAKGHVPKSDNYVNKSS